MIEWVKALSPIIVAVIPIIVAVFSSAKKTRRDTIGKIEELQQRLESHIKTDEWSEQKQRRLRILRCAYDITNGVGYTTDYLGEIIEDCDTYKQYCDTHDYPNGKAEVAIEIVRDEFTKKLKGDHNK